MTQKITQMKLVRYLFTAVLALLFVNCSKGHSADEPKSNNGAQTSSSKQVEDEIGFGQRELTLQVGETAKVTLHGAKNARVETSNSNLVEATLVDQGTAVSLKGLQAGEGTIRVLSSNRYAELRVVVKANEEGSNNPLNGKSIVWDEIFSKDYKLSNDGRTLIEWKDTSTENLDMNRDPRLRKITSIGKSAFGGCGGLKSIRIPSSVTSIGWGAFSNCSSLTSINIPQSVTSIGRYAFSGCSDLTSVTIPSSVTSIGEGVFYDCSSLKSVTIPSSVTSIGWGAFYDCKSLTSITIPSSVTSIGWRAFEGCIRLTSVTIPSSVTSIGEYAFFSCKSLTSITIPSSVTSIGESAFYGCSSLTSVTIPSSVTSIRWGTFEGCNSLTSVTIPSSVTSIERSVFSFCTSLTSVTIPSSVTSIGWDAFDNCKSLTSVVFRGNKPPKINVVRDFPFRGTPSSLKLIVPKGAKSAYIKAEYPEDKLIEE